jgi:tetratricopeptide (TPR) repeat protein
MNDQKSQLEELREIEAAIQAQESLLGSGILPDDQIESILETLREKRQIYLARLEGADAPAQISTGGGAYIEGDVNAGGDFIGRDKIDITIEDIDKKIDDRIIIEHQDLTVIFVLDPRAQGKVTKQVVESEDLDTKSLDELAAAVASEHIRRQIKEIELAQKEAEAQGVTLEPKDAYRLGTLAMYRRDYDSALDYFRKAAANDPEYSQAFAAVAWILQRQAMSDMAHQDYDAAMSKLSDAYVAAARTNPLDSYGLALRGSIAKTQAQIAGIQKDQASRHKYYGEAARMFKGALNLNSSDASAWNGLGNVEYAEDNLDAAIEAYNKAIELIPNYTAAHHDLAIAYERKMQVDPASADEWCQKALAAWKQAYHLAPNDPGFTSEKILEMGQRILELEQQCG